MCHETILINILSIVLWKYFNNYTSFKEIRQTLTYIFNYIKNVKLMTFSRSVNNIKLQYNFPLKYGY